MAVLTSYDDDNDNDDDDLLDPYHEVGDVEALAEKLEAIIKASLATNLPPKQGDRGGLRIKYDMGKYDWDRIAREVARVYEGL